MATELEHSRHGALVAPTRTPAGTQPYTDNGALQRDATQRPVTWHSAVLPTPAESPSRRAPNLALAGLQLALGYEWLASGMDKLLYGPFSRALGPLLTGTLRNSAIPAPFADLLRAAVLPHAAVFAILVEWGETLTGLGLIAAGGAALLAPWAGRRLGRQAVRWVARGHRALDQLAVAAAMAAGAMGLSFYALDGAPTPWFTPSIAFGGALDVGLLLALGSAVLLAAAAGEWLRRHARVMLAPE
jgi:uncharacterized membrane protein YphA (DoxX/SURF4 family)